MPALTGLNLVKNREPIIKAQSGYNIRAIAAKAIFAVLEQRKSLQEVLPEALLKVKEQDKAWLHEMVYGVLRQLPTLQFWLRQLLQSPIKNDARIIEHLLYLGLYQLHFSRVSQYAAVSETVSACQPLKQAHLKNLVNAVLRNFERQSIADKPPEEERVSLNLPKWYYKKLKAAYPDNYQDIAVQQACKPPIWLRVNVRNISATDFAAALSSAQIQFEQDAQMPSTFKLLDNSRINQLPGYEDGWFSVQDKAAQHAAHYLAPQPQETILDACAAPGGKYCHILELQPALQQCIALEVDEIRSKSILENTTRLGLAAPDVRIADANDIARWNSEQRLFDKILLDAPCSATGIIRRHPDILWLRKNQDISNLVSLQAQILDSLWSQLKPGGTLLYATCSILPEENTQQVAAFLARTEDAIAIPLDPTHSGDGSERQILPGESGMDGFYYAKLQKRYP
ncbi:16S rRNA (cytosine(967)-C(5))-methyltransferase RsmB [Planctobacterium marinum]|uniref:16S rRNA (cytosine(967)-C(5))-methyltransferase RsmB n=1 Tax=Planctobacterium marinum TaxID=1631968 RepID=UPI001E4F43F6|nr:16S rRNA (cytosine(967)-C(5))-methyltransferase RsmB [Planctobacterium marinum]MCC2607231.1 16S rRNA (cytosine(967)-C(5))-methyltransferase RsmB [Planctobacterium marinum]